MANPFNYNDLAIKYKDAKKTNFNNTDSDAKIQKVEFAQIQTNGNNYAFIIHINTNKMGPITWSEIEAPKYIKSLGQFGRVEIDKAAKGIVYLEPSSPSKVHSFMKHLKNNLDTPFTSFFEDAVSLKVEQTKNNKSLFEAANEEDVRGAEDCLNSGKYKVFDKDPYGNTLLHIAFFKNNFEMAKLAMKWGAYIDSNNSAGKNLIKLAIEVGNYQWYKFAVDNGSYIGNKDAGHNNLLHLATECYKNELALNKGIKGLKNYSGSSSEASNYKKIISDLAHKNHQLIFSQNDNDCSPICIAGKIDDGGEMYKVLVHEVYPLFIEY